jgi:hypothetical protein
VSAGPALVQPDGPVYRVGRAPDPWAWPDWAYAAPDGTFGNRWDDPAGEYRVLYAASQRLAAYVETLAPFRPDLAVVMALADIDGEDDSTPVGVVPRAWLDTRLLGEAVLAGQFVDIGDARSLATLRAPLASRAIHYGIAEIDAAAIRRSAPRGFTQEVSRFVHEWQEDTGPVAGIRYRSRYGDGLINWAIFESTTMAGSPVLSPSTAPLSPNDPELAQALQILSLRFG